MHLWNAIRKCAGQTDVGQPQRDQTISGKFRFAHTHYALDRCFLKFCFMFLLQTRAHLMWRCPYVSLSQLLLPLLRFIPIRLATIVVSPVVSFMNTLSWEYFKCGSWSEKQTVGLNSCHRECGNWLTGKLSTEYLTLTVLLVFCAHGQTNTQPRMGTLGRGFPFFYESKDRLKLISFGLIQTWWDSFRLFLALSTMDLKLWGS